MKVLMLIIFNGLILGLFLYSKLLPYKDKLENRFKTIFNLFDAIFTPIFNFLRKYISPFQVGNGLSIDMTQILILIILLLLLNIK